MTDRGFVLFYSRLFRFLNLFVLKSRQLINKMHLQTTRPSHRKKKNLLRDVLVKSLSCECGPQNHPSTPVIDSTQ